MANLLTVPEVAEIAGVPRHVVDHALLVHAIKPDSRIGNTRVWSRDRLQEILDAIQATAKPRQELATA